MLFTKKVKPDKKESHSIFSHKIKRRSKRFVSMTVVGSLAGVIVIGAIPAVYFQIVTTKSENNDFSSALASITPQQGKYARQTTSQDFVKANPQAASLMRTFPDVIRTFDDGKPNDDPSHAVITNGITEFDKQAKQVDPNYLDSSTSFNTYFKQSLSTKSGSADEQTQIANNFYAAVLAFAGLYDNFAQTVKNNVNKLVGLIPAVTQVAGGADGQISNFTISLTNVWYVNEQNFNFDVNYVLKFRAVTDRLGTVNGTVTIDLKALQGSNLVLVHQNSLVGNYLTPLEIDLTSLVLSDKSFPVRVYTNLPPPYGADQTPERFFHSSLKYDWNNDANEFQKPTLIQPLDFTNPLYATLKDPSASSGLIDATGNWMFSIILNYLRSSFDTIRS
ncbi:hypothetical protein [[Mycoplasma] testudinis]|uniref:hypothetical protein n=1 Tax=[Mycoplasma] testudinis TaxID=33924 RepID=UPI000489168A|nr:hypothetical protein [[Mycoplasma] testudinis]